MKKFFSLAILIPLVTLLGVVAYQQNVHAQDLQILSNSWTLSAQGGSAEKFQQVSPTILQNMTTLRITYNLHGLCALEGDASAIIFDQNGWKYVALSSVGKNCLDAAQTVDIPLSQFKDIQTNQPLDTTKPLTGDFHVRFWYNRPYTVDITSVSLLSSGSISPSVSPTPSTNGSNFSGITDGQIVSGKIAVSYNTPASTTKQVDFYIDGGWKWTEHYAPYFLGGDNGGVAIGWDTKQISDGSHTLKVVVTHTDGSTTSDQISFIVANASTVSTQVNPTLTPTPSPVQVTSTPTSTPTPSSVPTNPTSSTSSSTSGSFPIQSIDAMKDTKDDICGQHPIDWINQWLDKAVELGANYVAISTPYDNPSCGNALSYTKTWVQAIRAHGLKVWHRHMPLSFEGIYSVSKNNSSNYLNLISSYIKSNPDIFADGDIFTPIPEPQNGGIQGVTYCANSVCQFSSAASFNQWLRDAMTTSTQSFQSIGKNVKIGYFGFDGFVAWGDQNPDWHGILEDSTVAQMGNITIDHYPELVGETMDASLTALQAKYPNTPIVIGEWGTVNGQNVDQEVMDTMGAAVNHHVVGFNYWQFGPSGSGEQLINTDFSERSSFFKVQSFYKKN